MSDSIRCPYCKTKMDEAPLGPVVIDVCPGCKARWFDRTELAAASNHLAGAGAARFGSATPGGRVPGMICPREGAGPRIMGYIVFGVPFGRCEGCRGVLFNGQEWEALESALRSRGAPGEDSSAVHASLEVVSFLYDIGQLFI